MSDNCFRLNWKGKHYKRFVEDFAKDMRANVPELESASDMTLSIIGSTAARLFIEIDEETSRS